MAMGNGGKPPQPTFPYTWVQDAELNLNARYILKGLIEQASFTLIYGPSGSGKSFFTADIAQHIATGQAWRGRKVNQSLVVYVASEAGGSILKRFIGWRDNRLSEATERIPLAVLTRGPNLLLKQQVEDLRVQLAYMQDEAKLPLGQVVFDTLSRSMPGGDENRAEDMTEVISAADYLRDIFKAGTTFVHHSGKDVDRGARGHSSLFAAADCAMSVTEKVAVVEKARDGVAGEKFAFALEPVILGTDAEGDEVTTCLLNVADAVMGKQVDSKGLGKNQRMILDPLRALVSEKGLKNPGTSVIPVGVLTVSFDDLCTKCSPKYPALKPWQIRKKVNEALNGLEASGYAGLHDNLVWLR